MDLTDREKRCADCVDFMKRAITAMDDANEAAFQKSDSLRQIGERIKETLARGSTRSRFV